ncbi:hypothetical protein Ddye_028137 [Dipteronia dyeriana]|uniref:Ubiquitin-like domain-containing protein n=1 Tax=Dipteronia dyeriana TaxID=168575 RepID=A0AAD9TQG1_9ROSI|nr:hypothetical protein Ddye_028137 [Dipteronia dyeriana]
MTLRVKDKDHNELVFMVRKATPLKKLIDAYCVRKNVELNTFVFLFDGRHLRPEQTPDEAGLGDGDEIDTFQHQLGGVCEKYSKNKKIKTETHEAPLMESCEEYSSALESKYSTATNYPLEMKAEAEVVSSKANESE